MLFVAYASGVVLAYPAEYALLATVKVVIHIS
jgi:hypothetical protein